MRYNREELEFIISLIVISIKDYGVPLGMDRLASYHTMVDYFYKMVTIKPLIKTKW